MCVNKFLTIWYFYMYHNINGTFISQSSLAISKDCSCKKENTAIVSPAKLKFIELCLSLGKCL